MEKGRGLFHWKSPDELAAGAGERELCNEFGSGSLQVWLLVTEEEIPLIKPGWQRYSWFEARLGIQGCSLWWVPTGDWVKVCMCVCVGGEQGTYGLAQSRDGVWANRLGGPTQCTKPGVQIMSMAARRPRL